MSFTLEYSVSSFVIFSAEDKYWLLSPKHLIYVFFLHTVSKEMHYMRLRHPARETFPHRKE